MKLRVLIVDCQAGGGRPHKSKQKASVCKAIEFLPARASAEFISHGLFADLPSHLEKHAPDVLILRTHGERKDNGETEFDVPLTGLSRPVDHRTFARELRGCFLNWCPRIVIVEACYSSTVAAALTLAEPDMITIGFEGEPTTVCIQDFYEHLWSTVIGDGLDTSLLDHGTWVSGIANGNTALLASQKNLNAEPPLGRARGFLPSAGSTVYGPRDPNTYGGGAGSKHDSTPTPAHEVSSDRLQPTLRVWLSAHLPFFAAMALGWLVASAAITALIKRLVPSLETVPLAATTGHALLVLAALVDIVRLGPLAFTEEGESFYETVRKRIEAPPSSTLIDVWQRHGKNAIESQKQFFGGIRVLMLGWLLLYAGLLWSKIVQPDPLRVSVLTAKVFAVWQTTANNLATLGVVISFCVLTFVTTPEENPASSSKPTVDKPRRNIRRIYFVGIVVWILMLGANVVALADQVLMSTTWDDGQFIFDIASGLLGGVAFALLVGRFDSKFVDANPAILVLLYCYAAIQPLWILAKINVGPDVISERTASLVLLVSAMVLKGIFYLFLRWLMQSGRLLFYFGRVRDLYESVHLDWKRETSQTYSSTRTFRASGGSAFVTALSVGLAFASLAMLGASGASSAPPAVVFVGSGTTTSFLRCQAGVVTDMNHNPRVIVLPGGTQTGYGIARESDSHGKVHDPRLNLIGLSVGEPDARKVNTTVKGSPSHWAVAALDKEFPLGIVVRGASIETTSCQLQTRHLGKIDQCTRPGSIRARLEYRAQRKKANEPLTEALLVPDENGGTRQTFDALLWANGVDGDAKNEWANPTAPFTMDYADLVGLDHVIAFGLPSYNSGVHDCHPPENINRIGVCDTDTGDCKPIKLGLNAYFRVYDSSCAHGARCPAELSVCQALLKIYERLENAEATEWAREGCKTEFSESAALVDVDWAWR